MEKTRKFSDLIDVTLDEAVRNLQKSINYGDYLAEQKKKTAEEIFDKKEAFRRKKLVALRTKDICSASDAKTRDEQAIEYAQDEHREFERSQIEADYLSDLFKNNHDRVEALRTIISSKKQNLENYNRNQIN